MLFRNAVRRIVKLQSCERVGRVLEIGAHRCVMYVIEELYNLTGDWNNI